MAPALSVVTDDVEWGTSGAFPGVEDVYRGSEGIKDWIDVILSAWESFEVSTAEVLHDADDVVVVVERLFGRGRGSGAEAEMSMCTAYWFEEGRITRRRVFGTREEAIEAARPSG